MTPQELNSYRLTSMEEPTDEMLAAIMHEAAEDAKSRREIANNLYFSEIEQMVADSFSKIKLSSKK